MVILQGLPSEAVDLNNITRADDGTAFEGAVPRDADTLAGLYPAAYVYVTCFSTDNVPAETRASLFVIRPGSGNFEFVQSAGITNLPALSTTYFNVTYCC